MDYVEFFFITYRTTHDYLKRFVVYFKKSRWSLYALYFILYDGVGLYFIILIHTIHCYAHNVFYCNNN